MALVVLTIQDSEPGAVDLNMTCHPQVDLGPVDMPTDTPAIRIARRMVHVAKLTAARSNHHKPQEG